MTVPKRPVIFCNEVYHTDSDQLARLIEDLREERQEASR